MLDQQAACVRRGRRARVPADRALPGDVLDRRHRFGDDFALARFIHLGVALPAPAMGRRPRGLRAMASRASSGERSTARPQELTVTLTPWASNRSMMRHHAARVPYSKWLSMRESGPSSRCTTS